MKKRRKIRLFETIMVKINYEITPRLVQLTVTVIGTVFPVRVFLNVPLAVADAFVEEVLFRLTVPETKVQLLLLMVFAYSAFVHVTLIPVLIENEA